MEGLKNRPQVQGNILQYPLSKNQTRNILGMDSDKQWWVDEWIDSLILEGRRDLEGRKDIFTCESVPVKHLDAHPKLWGK